MLYEVITIGRVGLFDLRNGQNAGDGLQILYDFFEVFLSFYFHGKGSPEFSFLIIMQTAFHKMSLIFSQGSFYLAK